MAALERYSDSLVCPKCKRKGQGMWEENASPGPKGGFETELISLSKGFKRKKGDDSDDPEIVCKKCKVIVSR